MTTIVLRRLVGETDAILEVDVLESICRRISTILRFFFFAEDPVIHSKEVHAINEVQVC